MVLFSTCHFGRVCLCLGTTGETKYLIYGIDSLSALTCNKWSTFESPRCFIINSASEEIKDEGSSVF